MRLVKRLMS